MPDRPVILRLYVPDPPRRDDPEHVQAQKAQAAAESLCAVLRGRGELVTLVPAPGARADGAA